MGPQDFIAAQGAVGEPSAAAASMSPGSSSSSESDSSRCREMRDLVHKTSEARGWYSDVT
jgi:hypothetical protein